MEQDEVKVKGEDFLIEFNHYVYLLSWTILFKKQKMCLDLWGNSTDSAKLNDMQGIKE